MEIRTRVSRRPAWPLALLGLAALALAAACASAGDAGTADTQALELTLLHVNDTHSKVEPTAFVKFSFDIDQTLKAKPVYLNLGGYAALDSAVSRIRSERPNTLLVHAGDLFQGTLYFTKFLGAADVDIWNQIGLDAATLGNHEFDKSPALIQSALLDKATFPIVSSNIDFSQEKRITTKDKLLPWYVRQIGGARLGIIGVTTPDTPFISSPGDRISFADPAVSINQTAARLAKLGVNKIIVLSHLGYEQDLATAAKLEGVDLIVGGHSHTLLGDFSAVGMGKNKPYPSLVKAKDGQEIPVVQAWEWAKLLGRIDLKFSADGKLLSYSADPRFVVNSGTIRVYDLPNKAGQLKRVQFSLGDKLAIAEYDGKAYLPQADDPAVADDQYDLYKAIYDKLAPQLAASPALLNVAPSQRVLDSIAKYSPGIKELNSTIVAEVASDMPRKHNQGPGDWIADSMTWKTGAQIGMMNPGGVRVNLAQGKLSVGQVYELQPFGNTLVTLKASGAQIVKSFEDMVDFQVGKNGGDLSAVYINVSGVVLDLDLAKPKGERVQNVRLVGKDGALSPLDPAAEYSYVVNNFCADGGDMNNTLKSLGGKYNTGFVDSEAMLDYVQGKTLDNLKTPRVNILK